MDDHAVVRAGLEQLLAGEPRHRGGRQGRRRRPRPSTWCARLRPDVVLMDLQMPGTSTASSATRLIVGEALGRRAGADVVLRRASGSSPRSTPARSATCSRTPSPTTCSTASAPWAAASRRSTRGPPASCSARGGRRPPAGVRPHPAGGRGARRWCGRGWPTSRSPGGSGSRERTVKAHLTSVVPADRRRATGPRPRCGPSATSDRRVGANARFGAAESARTHVWCPSSRRERTLTGRGP